MEDGDRSVIEIRHLLHKLHPTRGSHKDRVRVLSRFRNYVSGTSSGTKKKGQKVTTPEFYDDDLPLLFLGSDAPVGQYDEDQYGDLSGYYGLLKACATPSTDHTGGLKRSARNAMNLLKYLVIDHEELKDGEPINNGVDAATGLPELNAFAYTFCSLMPSQLRLANFDAHLKDVRYHGSDGDTRSGAKGDACEVLVLLLTRHFDPDNLGNGNKPGSNISIGDLLTTSEAMKAFDNWMLQNVSKDVQNSIKRNTNESSIPVQITSTPDVKTSSNPFGNDGDDDDVVDVFKPDSSRKVINAEASADRQQRLEKIGITLDIKDREDLDGPPTCWKDSALANQLVQLSVAEGVTSTVNDKMTEKWSEQIEERKRLIGRDPMGIRPDNFDLRSIKDRVVQVLEGCIEDLEVEIEEGGHQTKSVDENRRKRKDKYAYSVEQLASLEAQKAALESILNGDQVDVDDEDAEEKRPGASELSILPADSNFDPLLFLTVIHRDTNYEQLQESITKLENKTDNQTQRIQQLIRENFELFIKCADGIDLFKAGSRTKNTPSVGDWLNRIDKLAESTSENAKKSFKPLLDNTNEVRKVQSALAVLQRVGPLLQVPSLMRQHIENGRFSAAVATYRRALVIDENTKINLLRHVKQKATEAANDARIELESRLANPNLPVQTILESIKSLTELIELEIPTRGIKAEGGTKDENSNLDQGKHVVGEEVRVDVRLHPPSLSCLLLQAAHFTNLVAEVVDKTESTAKRIYDGEPLLVAMDTDDNTDDDMALSSRSLESKSTDKRERIRWKYDVLESRVLTAIKVVTIARTWLPRLIRIAETTRQSEMRQAARAMRKRPHDERNENGFSPSAFEVFVTNICPAIELLVNHGAFVSLGTDELLRTKPTYGIKDMDERLKKLILSPLPAAQTSKCALELASLAEVVQTVSRAALNLRTKEDDYGFGPDRVSQTAHYHRAAMETTVDKIILTMEEIVIGIERRKCIYAFDQCNRSCSMRASGSGIFDCDSIISCCSSLSQELTRPESCTAEIQKGCEQIFKQCCEGLASYVNDRGDSARLSAVGQSASVLNEGISHLVREVSDLTNQDVTLLEESLVEEVLALEHQMFELFLESIRRNMKYYTKLEPMVNYDEDEFIAEKQRSEASFPSHLSASLLAIVRCRANVEKTLGLDTVRKHTDPPLTYQFLSLSCAADSVVDGVCYEISQRMSRMRGSQADQYLNELQFLLNTLKKYLSDDRLDAAEVCKSQLLSKIGGSQGQGPEGLGAIERLERLGRVYVMCLVE